MLFLLPALSLAGIPPFSGFVAKFSLVDSTAAAEQWAILGVGVVVSLLTLFSMAKIWIGVFWAASEARRPARRTWRPSPTSRSRRWCEPAGPRC